MIFRDLKIRRELNGKGKVNILKRDTTKGAINLEEKPSNRELESWKLERGKISKLCGQWKLKGDPLQWRKDLARKAGRYNKRMKIDNEEDRKK